MESELPPPGRLPASGWTVLILRDVLDWSAADAASLLGLSPAALDGELAQARATMPADRPGERERAALARFIGSSDPAGVALARALLREHRSVS